MHGRQDGVGGDIVGNSAARAAARIGSRRRGRASQSWITEPLESRQLLSIAGGSTRQRGQATADGVAYAMALHRASGNAVLTIDNQSVTYASLTDTAVTMTGRSELHINGAGAAISGSVVNLNSPDAWFFMSGVRPSVVNATYLSQIRVNGAAAVLGSNVRVVQYELGTVVMPHAPSYQPFQGFTGPNFTGTSKSLGQYTYYNNAGALGQLYRNVSSFKLKRGYMAVVATQTNGSGYSKTYIAQDNDLDVSLLSSDFDNAIQFVHVLPWRWVSKKGASDLSPTTLDASWFYNWNNNAASTLDYEYVPIRQQRYWPGLPFNQPDVNELSGFNEPDNPVEDAYKTLDNGSVDTAIAVWPDLLSAGVRVGSPAVTDGGKSWLYSFMDKAIAAHLRVDYITIHNYQANNSASSLYNWLKDVWDRYHLPIWVTEFNNGANWTGYDPTLAQNGTVISSFIDMMDSTPWIERYSIYSSVGTTRQMTDSTGALTPAGVAYKNNASPIGYQQNAAPAPNTTGRSIAQLSLDGNALDTSGYGNNGEAVGVPAYVAGQRGQALQFDGADDFVRLADNVARGNALSFAGWVYWDGGANYQRIFDFGAGTDAYAFLTPSTGTRMRFAIKNGGAEQIVETSTPLPTGQWTHVAVTLGGGVAKLYVNGALAATNSAVTIKPSDFASTQNYLGKSQYAVDPLFKGRLDSVQIADYVLTGSQIAALMTDTAPQFGSATIARGPARSGVPFNSTVAGLATDPDAGDTVTYAKANGPAWLTVAADGTLSGTPSAADHFPQEFVITATDARGMSASAVVTLSEYRGIVQLPFNGNALDTSGYGNNAQTVGAPPYVTGQRGQALFLDGTTKYAQLTDNVAHGDEFSFVGWVFWNGGANWQRIFDFGNDATSYMFLSPSSGTAMRFAINAGAGEQIVETAALPLNAWTHVAVTLGAGAAKLYVNGALAATNTVTAKPSDLRPVVNYLGKSQFAADPLFKGRLDDILITDYVLTAAQIGTLMTAAGTPTIQTPATATLDTATGSTASLAVLGDDDGGEANLTYTWAVASKPAGAPDPMFSANASNAAKNSIATFTRVGTYTLMVGVRDADGLTATSSVTVVVNAVIAGIVSPSSAIASSSSVAVTGIDQFGQSTPIGAGATWSASIGSITSTGVYTAPATGATSATITAIIGSTTFTTTVSIVAGRGWYKADVAAGATLTDSSGSNNNGLLGGAYSYVAGKAGNALALAGGFADLPDGIVNGLTNFTIAAWVYLDANPLWARVFDFGTGTNAYMFLSNNNGGTNTMRFAITTGGGAGEQIIEAPAIPLATWTHVAVTLVGNVGTIYVNGVGVASNANITLRPTNLGVTTNNYLGDSQYAADAAFQGKLDDFRILPVGLNAAAVGGLRDAWQVPTVATPAAASATTTTGPITSNLTVLGASAAGEAGLTYTWSVRGTPPGAVTFNVNGSNAAKNAVATFGASGTYQLIATISNALGESVSSPVTVSVVVTANVVSANDVYGVGGHSLQFTLDRDVPAQPWSSLIDIKSADGTLTITPTNVVYDSATRTLTVTLPAGGGIADGNYLATLKKGSMLSSDYVMPFFVLAGDANHDRTVNFTDLLAVAQNYGAAGKTYEQGDFSGDGIVNFDDLLALAQNYNKSIAAAASFSNVLIAAAPVTTKTRRANTAAALNSN